MFIPHMTDRKLYKVSCAKAKPERSPAWKLGPGE